MAELQHGHLLRAQFLAAGFRRGALAHRLRTGWLREVHPSVYRVGGLDSGRLGRMIAAAMYLRGYAGVTGLAAASLWQMLDTTQRPADEDPVDVLLVGRNARRRPGMRIHRVQTLTHQDIRRRSGVPVTSPARTLLDLAGTMGDLELETALAAALRRRLVRRSNLADVMKRNPRAKGIGLLRSLLEQTESLHDTRSKYERKLLELLRAAELPMPLTNTWVAGQFVDGVWPDLKLVYEFDGWLYHRDKFESDRLRDQRMLIADHRVIRVSRRQIDFTPYALVARLASIITTLRWSLEGAQAAKPS